MTLLIIVVATFLAFAGGILFVVFGAYSLRDLFKSPKDGQSNAAADARLGAIGSDVEGQSSPLRPKHLVDLFIRPRKFFTSQIALGKRPYLIFVTWCYGMATAVSMINRDLAQAGKSRPPLWKIAGLAVTDSWLDFWLWVVTAGAVAGLFLLLVGGWWYSVRLAWAGAKSPDEQTSRLLYMYSAFVPSAPIIVLALCWTAIMPSYGQALTANRNYSPALLVFFLWSLITSYVGVRSLFAVHRWKARTWFLILPAIFYILTILQSSRWLFSK